MEYFKTFKETKEYLLMKRERNHLIEPKKLVLRVLMKDIIVRCFRYFGWLNQQSIT